MLLPLAGGVSTGVTTGVPAPGTAGSAGLLRHSLDLEAGAGLHNTLADRTLDGDPAKVHEFQQELHLVIRDVLEEDSRVDTVAAYGYWR